MAVNLPPKVRVVIYILATLSQPVMFYLLSENTITSYQYGLYAVVMGAITALAAVNVDTK
jgi:hypothetical protein